MRRASFTAVFLAALFSVAGVVAVASCTVGDLDLTGKACPCVAGYVCDTTQNVCVLPGDAATTDAPIAIVDGSSADSGPECTVANDTCPPGRYCTTADVCAVGCKANSECAALSPSAPFCDLTRRQCIQCESTLNCTGSQQCSPAGTCVDACATDASVCVGGSQCCNGLCVDVTSDVFNCNVCGTTCTGAQTLCCAGSCTDPLSSAVSCGACGAACSTLNGTPSCSNGNCAFACNPGFGHCQTGNTGCETDTTTSIAHCGTCATNCDQTVLHANGISCAASACTYTTCISPFTDCDGLQTDGCECGPCGAQGQPCCEPGDMCNGGLQCKGDHNCH